ncbi:hypothetical protein KAU34_04545, partial [candidate division WOR-3 bacterium]|nr:hypothetical protein [candidate division WOR-3 bacterium]
MIKKCFYCFILLPLLISIMWAENLPPEKTKVLIDPSLEPAVLNTNQEILYPISEGRQIDTLIYDDGSPSSGYYWGAGARMANRMSPTQACQILTIQYYCWSRVGSETIDATIYDWTGTMPGSQLGTSVSLPMDATQQWRNADFSSQNINVTGDFIASFNMNNDQTVIGFDAVNNGRAWDYNGTSWSAWNETYFIRAIVDYGGTGEPDIECNPNPLNVSAKDWGNFLQFTYRNYPMKIDERLMEKMENVSPEELLPVIIECDKLIDTDFLYSLVKGMGKAERRSFTINTLQEFTSSYQEDVYEYLESMENAGKVDRLSQLWLTNS